MIPDSPGAAFENAAEPGIYLDHHATTPCDPRVSEAMLPLFAEDFGNPSSTQHAWGRRALGRVEAARRQVALLVGAEPAEVIFTSGATEADNLALFGTVEARLRDLPAGASPHVITQVSEHKAVLDACAAMERRGVRGRPVRVTYLPVEADGRLDPARVEHALSPETVLVSVMVANNEIGVTQPVAEVAEICRRAGIWLHADGAQALAHGDCHRHRLGWDLLSLSAHKAYGPKGVGALIVRRRRPRVRLEPRAHGGGHERGRRSGTLAVPLLVGFGRACELVAESTEAEAGRLAALRDHLLASLRRSFPGLEVNGSLEHRLPHNLNVSLPGLSAEDLMAELQALAVSSGAACTSTAGDSSHVLAALPGGRERAERALRFGLGRGTTEQELERAVAELERAAPIARQRAASRAASPEVCGVGEAAHG
ncbi:MAG: cysteine desulfurase [Holophagales bacterium]|nr:cysteine desulfurase [Holophagales bacterium]